MTPANHLGNVLGNSGEGRAEGLRPGGSDSADPCPCQLVATPSMPKIMYAGLAGGAMIGLKPTAAHAA